MAVGNRVDHAVPKLQPTTTAGSRLTTKPNPNDQDHEWNNTGSEAPRSTTPDSPSPDQIRTRSEPQADRWIEDKTTGIGIGIVTS